MRRHMNRGLAVVAALALVPLAGCVSLPSEGPIVESDASGQGAQSDAMNINPRGPQPGQSAVEVVKGWLDAMQATPIRTTVAREFLSQSARDTWAPTETITYAAASQPSAASGQLVTVTLTGADSLDDRGAWRGPLGEAESTLEIPMVREDGEWRINDPEDALIVPESWFEQRFRQVSLYFFDPTARVLVPDPVFVPRGRQLASALVDGLLAGPAPALAAYALSAVPTDLRAAVSVPVSADGVADIELTGNSGDVAALTGEGAELMINQLAWTLRQDPSIERLRVSIGGTPVEVAGQTEFSVDQGDRYAPYVADASTLLYGLEDGLVVGGSAQSLDPVTGPFGEQAYGLRSVSLDMPAEQAAGVSSDGTSLLVGPVGTEGSGVEQLLSGATDLLDPAWDFSGRLWIVDRREDGARVKFTQGGRMRSLKVPGISGRDVRLMLVSRDGSRLVAVVRGRRDDTILVSRLLSDGRGDVVGALPAVEVSEPGGRSLRIRDIAWRSPTSIVVLHEVSDHLFQVRAATVDGAPNRLEGLSLTLDGRIIALAGTPTPDVSVYAVTRGSLIDLAGASAGTIAIDPDVTSLGYVG